MNTIELTSIVRKIIINGTNFLGILACDQLPKHIRLLGDGLIAFTFNMLVYNFLSNLLRQLSP